MGLPEALPSAPSGISAKICLTDAAAVARGHYGGGKSQHNPVRAGPACRPSSRKRAHIIPTFDIVNRQVTKNKKDEAAKSDLAPSKREGNLHIFGKSNLTLRAHDE